MTVMQYFYAGYQFLLRNSNVCVSLFYDKRQLPALTDEWYNRSRKYKNRREDSFRIKFLHSFEPC